MKSHPSPLSGTPTSKSSLLNRLTGAGVLVDDALFATLDPTTCRAAAVDGRVYTLTDTVGFVRHLPHDLVEAFASTLEESTQADLLVHVVDGSDPDPVGQIDAVRAVLGDIGAAEIPELIVINKVDRAAAESLSRLGASYPDAVFVSARTGRAWISYAPPSSRCCRGRRSRFVRSSRTSAVTWSTAFIRPASSSAPIIWPPAPWSSPG